LGSPFYSSKFLSQIPYPQGIARDLTELMNKFVLIYRWVITDSSTLSPSCHCVGYYVIVGKMNLHEGKSFSENIDKCSHF
jgi:hypothetical protein